MTKKDKHTSTLKCVRVSDPKSGYLCKRKVKQSCATNV